MKEQERTTEIKEIILTLEEAEKLLTHLPPGAKIELSKLETEELALAPKETEAIPKHPALMRYRELRRMEKAELDPEVWGEILSLLEEMEVDVMVGVKEAVIAAFNFLNDLYASEELIDLALEEVELSDDEKYWLVTLGFTRQFSKPLELATVSPWEAIGPKRTFTNRDYKIIKVDASTGKAESMRIRQI